MEFQSVEMKGIQSAGAKEHDLVVQKGYKLEMHLAETWAV
jgi:hypothetical protein